MKVEKDYGYMADLQSAILEARLTSDKGLPKTRKKGLMTHGNMGFLQASHHPGPVANPIPQRSRYGMNPV